MKTIRETIEKYRNEVAKGELQPPRAAEILTELSALKGNILDEIRKNDRAYNFKLREFRQNENSATDAKIAAECSDEYFQKREARDTNEVVTEIIRALKYYLREMAEGYRQSGN